MRMTCKQSDEMKNLREKRSHWREAYHASRWLCAHAVLTEGFIESIGKQKLPGVWNMDNLMAGSFALFGILVLKRRQTTSLNLLTYILYIDWA